MIFQFFIKILVIVFIFVLGIPAKAQESHNLYSNINTSKLLLKQSKPDKSITLIFAAINTEKISKDTLILCNILLAEAYRQKREYNKGKELLFSLLKDAEISNYNKAYAYNRIAAIYDESKLIKISKFDTVLKYSEISLKISEEYGFDNLKYSSYNEIGYVYKNRKKYLLAKEYLEKAFDGFISQKEYENAINTSLNLAYTNYHLGNKDEAMKIIDNAIALGNPQEDKNVYGRLYLAKSNFYKSDGNFESAYYWLIKSKNLVVSFYGDRINSQINEMSAKYDLQQKESEIIESQQQNKIQKQKNKFYTFAIIVLLIVLVVLILVLRLLKKNQMQRRELIQKENDSLKKDLEFKNKELTLSTMNMIRHSEFVSSLVPDLKELYKLDSDNRKQSILNIVRSISIHNKTELWEDFYKSFSEVNTSFNNNLMTKHPDLSSKERRLCALLKLDMSTKDIASISHTSVRGLETARHRLRKKLKINGNVNLCNYLQEF